MNFKFDLYLFILTEVTDGPWIIEASSVLAVSISLFTISSGVTSSVNGITVITFSAPWTPSNTFLISAVCVILFSLNCLAKFLRSSLLEPFFCLSELDSFSILPLVLFLIAPLEECLDLNGL